ncbi:MAG: dTDP-4-dehydrorhamnose reductase [Pseudomonadota bacterium]
MTLLVFGKTGQVASALQAIAPQAIFLGREDADLADAAACADALRAHRPDAVINAAAYTAVDQAESDRARAFDVNGTAPAAMAEIARDLAIPFVHISTDYVFDGAGETAFRPGDPTGPLGVYGASKLAGEDGIRAAGGRFGILRTSWVFSAHGKNFVKTMLRLSDTREALTIVADQVGGPTSAGAIARACLTMVKVLRDDPGLSGTYHFSGAPDVSWAGFAREIFQQAGRTVTVTDISTADYPTPAARPLNSRLDCTATASAFGIARPDWKEDLHDVLAGLGALGH